MMAKVNSFEDLEIYQLSEELALEIYQITTLFPDYEKFGIISQLRRAVLSIGANIAESYGRFHYRDKINFLYNARGSLLETKHFLRFSCRSGLLEEGKYVDLVEKVDKLGVKLNNYIRSLSNSAHN